MKLILMLLACATFLGCSSTKFDGVDYKPLFVAEADLNENWIGNTKGYKVVDGALVTQKKAGNIYTKEVYQDYVFKFEFALPPGGNNGLGLRIANPDNKAVFRDVAYGGVELQILDDTHPSYKKLKPWQFHGSAYGLAAAKKGFLKPVGEWNTQEVYLRGNHLVVRLNGEIIQDVNLSEVETNQSPYNKKQLGAGRNRGAGHIAFAGHGENVKLRNIHVARLADDYSIPQTKDNVAPEGFTALFDGKSLDNWKGLLLKPHDKPHMRKGLSGDKLAELQKKADESMNKHWSITENGELFFDGAGFSLATEKKYKNFEFHVSWKIEKNGDSGIYLRGLPQVQIWDPSNLKMRKHGNEKGSGGLWNNPDVGKFPLVVADNPTGEWNHFFIRMIGNKVTIWLNGKLVVNDAPLANLWEKGKPIPTMEQIELQCHGDPVWFKNIYVKELP
ncbi:MAG: DUF1080 domain-containing protein [Lentisphaeraceae bacterium]|nr:DUF1080 domain-containing protein [Lentisphaeraceae bacterium]